MYQFAFGRNRMALSAASAMMIFMTVASVMVPYIYSELRREARNER
ncbi:sugar ABC transporter permease [Mesorhizobium sp. M5C.F.Ca.IN.020.32.2.1]|nr:sugar ABC transporter permease [Mesorhizobium sp. M5C.F.Ca.IN.020.32.2.1]